MHEQPKSVIPASVKALIVALVVALASVLGSSGVRKALGLVEATTHDVESMAVDAELQLESEGDAGESSSEGSESSSSEG